MVAGNNTILPLALNDVTVKKRGKLVLGPLSLQIASGAFTVIIGPNGAGKTMLLRLMHGLDRARMGTVRWNQDVMTARKQQSFVFQTPIMLRRSAIENIAYPLRLQGKNKGEARAIALDWLARIGLADALEVNAMRLSGGEKQKLALARALATGPEILFLDEPTASLDGTSTREIETLLKEAHAKDITIVMTTHDLGQARRLAGDIVFLYAGCPHETGKAEQFFANARTAEAKAFLNGEIVE